MRPVKHLGMLHFGPKRHLLYYKFIQYVKCMYIMNFEINISL